MLLSGLAKLLKEDSILSKIFKDDSMSKILRIYLYILSIYIVEDIKILNLIFKEILY